LDWTGSGTLVTTNMGSGTFQVRVVSDVRGYLTLAATPVLKRKYQDLARQWRDMSTNTDQMGVSTAYPLVYHAAHATAPGGVCMSSMKRGGAKAAILSEYERWAKKHPDDAAMMGGFLFFRYLQNERSELLDFRAVGSKWQIVHGWIQDRVKD
jgi:hypothetical protein